MSIIQPVSSFPINACPTDSLIISLATTPVVRISSTVSETGPNVEFSTGTTPYVASPRATAWKTTVRGVSSEAQGRKRGRTRDGRLGDELDPWLAKVAAHDL